MITKLYKNSSLLDDFCDFAALKVKSLIRAYGFNFDFFKVYLQLDADSASTALICDFYGSATVSITERADISELQEFLSFISLTEILCSKTAAEHFCGTKQSCFAVFCDKAPATTGDTLADCESLKKLHSLFTRSGGDISLGLFDEWYPDINHRLRHNAAYVSLREHCGALLLTDGETLILSGIAVDPSHQKKGIGRQLLETLKTSFPETRLVALCTRDKLDFYQSCGFSLLGEYTLIYRR